MPNNLIYGSDIDNSTILKAKDNAYSYENFSSINLTTKSFEDIDLIKDKIIITNPPYGIRQNTIHEAELILKSLEIFETKVCWHNCICFFGNKEIMKKIGLKPDKKYQLIQESFPAYYVDIQYINKIIH